MKMITVVSDDRVGLLADISYVLGKSGINIEGVNVDVCAGKAIVALALKNTEKAEEVLSNSGYSVNPSDWLFIKHGSEPSIDELKRTLLRHRIHVEKLNLVAQDIAHSIYAMSVDRPRKAVKVLREILINGPA
jgi:hypothetical protein